MTRRQRMAHLLLWLVLGPLALAGLVLAVAWRPGPPVQDGALPGIGVPEASGQPSPESSP